MRLFGAGWLAQRLPHPSLHLAADASGTAEVLLKRGTDANAKNNKGLTLLDIAAVFNVSATAEVLRRYGTRR